MRRSSPIGASPRPPRAGGGPGSDGESDDSIQRLAHDLHQPLCATKGNIELLRDYYGDRLDERAREWLTAAIRACDRMFERIEDFAVPAAPRPRRPKRSRTGHVSTERS